MWLKALAFSLTYLGGGIARFGCYVESGLRFKLRGWGAVHGPVFLGLIYVDIVVIMSSPAGCRERLSSGKPPVVLRVSEGLGRVWLAVPNNKEILE